VGEDVRRIEVKVIDDVAVGDRRQREQVVNGGPSASGHDHRMLRRRLSDRRDELRLHATPPIAILELGLVQHLEKQSIIVEAGEMPGEVVPELRESLDLAIVAFERLFEIARWMHVHDHGEILRDEHLDCALELDEILAADDTR
jgi:hypothetical protein